MGTSALTMLIVAILMIWGGLALAIVNLLRHPEPVENINGADDYDPTV